MAELSDRERFEQLSQTTKVQADAERAAQEARQQTATEEQRRRDVERTQSLFSHLQQFKGAVPPKIGMSMLVERGSVVPALGIETPDDVDYVVFSAHGNPFLAARCRADRFQLVYVNGRRAEFADRRAMMDRLIEYLSEVELQKNR
jgi:hypothetical protein